MGGYGLKQQVSVSVASIIREPSQRIADCRGWARRQRARAHDDVWLRASLCFHALYQTWIVEFLLRQYPLPPSRDGRHIPLTYGGARVAPLSDERRGAGKPYLSNFIRSNRYTVWSFLPKQLYYQFSKLANFYFLIIAILQAIPGLSTTGRITTLATLIPFIAFSMAKEGYDDWRRYQLDKGENRSLVTVLDPQKIATKASDRKTEKRTVEPESCSDNDGFAEKVWSKIQWQNLRVGDIVRLGRDENVPADIILLHSSGPDGVAYVETMALDGETNLKSKQACPLLAKRCNSLDMLKTIGAEIVSEDPNLDLYNYEGRVTVDGQSVPLTLNEVVYRGSTIRNTTYAIGIVVNTGEECKIRMNANKEARAKVPAMQRQVNLIVLFLVLIVVLLGVGLFAGNRFWNSYYLPKAWYLAKADVTNAEIFIGFVIMFNTLIPLSLIVSLEIIKIGQYLLMQDVEMYDPETDTPMVVNTTSILENLGQVSYVFSDKTGTLTENKMQFRKMTVAGAAWLHDTDLAESAEDSIGTMGGRVAALKQRSSVDQANTERMLRYVSRNPNTTFSKKAKQFLLCIALCHTCLPEKKPDGKIGFQAASPDELALVKAAQELGFLLIDRSAQTITLQTQGETEKSVIKETYEILDVIEFSSKRKRMSIILRMPDGRICIFCKGADNVILPRLKLAHLAVQKACEVGRRATIRKSERVSRELYRRSMQVDCEHLEPITDDEDGASPTTYDLDVDESVAANDGAVFERCFQHIEDFATEGLRTLIYGYRYIDDVDYESWRKIYQEATTSISNRQNCIEEAGELVERDFELAGATAIEDKLQVGVPETIEKLRRANIKVWMLTGDKRETAINIAHSARICKPFSELYVLDATQGDLQASLAATLLAVCQEGIIIAHSVVVVDGHTLAVIDEDATLSCLFYDLAVRADSVICCRASPSQKSNLVKRIRDAVPSSLTLAIGDGANDIAMIQASHVGIGISGQEGLQAARISDYSIAQFRFLQRLLFVHGRWNYLRTGKYMVATFWKEMLFYLMQAHYQRWNGYTGTSLYESTNLAVFNTLFTSLCVILPGIFEKDLRAETLLAMPELYTYGQRNESFNFKKYLGWTSLAILQSAIIYVIATSVYGTTVADHDLFALGQVVFTVCIVFINTKLLVLEVHHQTLVTWGGWALSVGGWFFWNLFLSHSGVVKGCPTPYSVWGGFAHFARQPVWWATIGAALAAVTALELVVVVLRRAWAPTDVDVAQELEKVRDRRVEREARRGDKELDDDLV